MDNPIQRLEEKIAYLEHHVTEQDKVILELSEDLERLRREVKRLLGRLEAAAESSGGPVREEPERPPHY